METIQMLKTLCQANGVAGCEDGALTAAETICKSWTMQTHRTQLADL